MEDRKGFEKFKKIIRKMTGYTDEFVISSNLPDIKQK